MSLFSSLTNRIFFGSALLAVGSIAIAIYNVNVAVTRQAEQELRRGLDEAGTIIDEYRHVLVDHFTREARLIADLPRLKAARRYQRSEDRAAARARNTSGSSRPTCCSSPAGSGQTLAEITSANARPDRTRRCRASRRRRSAGSRARSGRIPAASCRS